MNKRIDELAEQCYVKTGSVHTDHFAYWKFAELIVREAMDYASRNWEHGHLLAEDLRVYFGVKE